MQRVGVRTVCEQEANERRQGEKAKLMTAMRRLTVTSVLLSRRRDVAQSMFDEVRFAGGREPIAGGRVACFLCHAGAHFGNDATTVAGVEICDGR